MGKGAPEASGSVQPGHGKEDSQGTGRSLGECRTVRSRACLSVLGDSVGLHRSVFLADPVGTRLRRSTREGPGSWLRMWQGHVPPAVLRTVSGRSKLGLNPFVSFQNVTANHRANDVIAAEDGPQVLVGRFMYGPLDMVALTGEKVRGPRRPSRAARGRRGEGWGGRPSGGSQEQVTEMSGTGGGGRGGETSVRLRGRRGAGRRAPWPGPSAAPAAPRLQGVPRPLPRAGGHPGDGRAVVGPLGAPGHGDHHQQRPDHVQRAAAPAPGGWRLPRKDGCQVRCRRVLAARPAGLSSRRGPRVLPPPARPRLAAG